VHEQVHRHQTTTFHIHEIRWFHSSVLPMLQESNVTKCQPSVLPDNQQQEYFLDVTYVGRGLSGRQGWRWLPLHDVRITGDVRIGIGTSTLLSSYIHCTFQIFKGGQFVSLSFCIQSELPDLQRETTCLTIMLYSIGVI